MKISPEAAMQALLASPSAGEGDAESFSRMLEGAAPKPGKAARMRATRVVPQAPRPSAPPGLHHSRSEPAAEPAPSMPKPGSKQDAESLAPGMAQAPETPRDFQLAKIPLPTAAAPSSPAVEPVANIPPAPPAAASAGPASVLPPVARATAANPAPQSAPHVQAEDTETRSPDAPQPSPEATSPKPATPAETSARAPVRAPVPPQRPVQEASVQAAGPPASPPPPVLAPLALHATVAATQHGSFPSSGSGSKITAPRSGANSGSSESDSGPGSERSAARPALASASPRFNLLVAEAGSFRSEAQNAPPGPAEISIDQPVQESPAQDQPQHLGDALPEPFADVVISLSEDARLDVTLGAASKDDASRMEAETASLHAELAALGTEVEAIRVELRRDPAPDARTGSMSAAWLQSGASHGWAGEKYGADQHRAGPLAKGFPTPLPGAGSGGREAGSVGKVDRYA